MIRACAALAAVGVICLGAVAAADGAAQQPSLFRVADAESRWVFAASRVGFHRPRAFSEEAGMEFELGSEIHWSVSPWAISNFQTTAFKFLGSGNYGLSAARQTSAAGVQVGPLALQGGVCISVFNADLLDDRFSMGLLWPGAIARSSVRLGAATIAVAGRAEYWWRWFGPDRYAVSIGVSVGLDQAPAMPWADRQDTSRKRR